MALELEEEIEQTISSLALSQELIARVEPEKAAQIIQAAKSRFVLGNPRAWWLSLRVPYQVKESDGSSGTPSLMRCWTPGDTFCWFIPETEEEASPVYETTVPVVEKLLAECSFFEYYLVNKAMTHILIETDHNKIITAEYVEN